MRHYYLISLLLIIFSAPSYSGQIYKCERPDGSKSFSNQPCGGKAIDQTDQLTSNTSTSELTSAALQGKWLITMVGDMDMSSMDLGEDIWQFSGNQWTAISSGRALSPEPFSLDGNIIDTSGIKIKVLEFTGSRMKVDTMGIIQTLEKR
ncbi:DUF4124 domain-containing protein [Aestuariirhabdus sp. Z084]|uniref:DUF4124 domain-containing protein n=1 Tax=Aestuariirhabdus haliotis TaxID=2918751 RepID=UPI00201B38EC|nr:DUF4124 domain-containing protein [Aestuariirhabdus haliotis]MCL6417793.1 DUF4124 domain-containing protein [Aestuariirhabdus haliotis]MCL6421720.1 DUF4124 domain-containing protein [Aestuariirhabdus haliotis]